MLATVKVNGTLSELSVGPEAITWRRACTKKVASSVETATAAEAANNKYSQLVDSPIANQNVISGQSSSKSLGKKAQKDKKIDFNQIIGIKRVVHQTKCDRQAKHDNGELEVEVDTSDRSNANSLPLKFKVYYAQRKEHVTKLKRLRLECAGEEVRECMELQLEFRRRHRPRRLLVFVNPYGGKGRAVEVFEKKVKRVFELAQIECELIITKYANHARETLEDPQFNLNYFDGIICVGGDGMFAELMNGLLFRANRDKLLASELKRLTPSDSDSLESNNSLESETSNNNNLEEELQKTNCELELSRLRSWLGGIGERFESPSLPVGVIGAGSTDANLFGFQGSNDVLTATLNIVLGNQIDIDIGSVHSLEQDKLLRFVSTFVAYGYFGDVIRESEKLRWLGPSRYDLTALNNLIRYRHYEGHIRIWRQSSDGSPRDPSTRCQLNCSQCQNQVTTSSSSSQQQLNFNDFSQLSQEPIIAKATCEFHNYELIETRGPFVGVNAAVTACRCPQTRKGFSPNNHLANGCADLILVRPCTRLQYVNYLLRTGYTRKSAFDLKYVQAHRCRQFEFIVPGGAGEPLSRQQVKQCDENDNSTTSGYASSTTQASTRQSTGEEEQRRRKWAEVDEQSSWNADGEILQEQSIRVKVNQKLLRVFGTGEPAPSRHKRKQQQQHR